MTVKELKEILKSADDNLEVCYVKELNDINKPFDETLHIDDGIVISKSINVEEGVYLFGEGE